MHYQDFVITPIFMLLFLMAAYVIRPWAANSATWRYFLPALWAKFIGAIALGLIYQFYYGGGDTFNFHTHGSHWIWQAVMDNPLNGIKMFFADGKHQGSTFQYSQHIWFFRDAHSYFVIKIAAFFDLLTYGTYSATALFFAAFAFSGHWVLYSTLQKLYPDRTKLLAIALLFVPSTIFWGSGLLKDSITLSALCWMTHLLFEMTVRGRYSVGKLLLLLFFGWIIYSIKLYILLSFLAAAAIFLYKQYSGAIKNGLIRTVMAPFIGVVLAVGVYYMMQTISAGDSKYSLENIGQTAMITAYDIRYGWGARGGDNSGYTLGELDGSIGSLVALAPQAMVVTLFRPWLWEVRNPLMLLSALESLVFLWFTLATIFRSKNKHRWKTLGQPILIFCLVFSLFFAFAVGASTYNFGTLMRYKIPVMPFYLSMLIILRRR